MNKLIKDALDEWADSKQPPRVDAAGLIRSGRRRRLRIRIAAGASACAATTAAVLAMAALPLASTNDSGPAYQARIETTGVTYALGSTIYSDNDEIDVSPYEPLTFVRTDDGFVFVAGNGNVYFTDGIGIEQIGDRARGHLELAADDSGSYVGWVEAGTDGPPETVVYDTAARSEVRRTSDGNRGGCFPDHPNSPMDEPTIGAIDGDVAYLCNADGVVAWNLVTGKRSRTLPAGTIAGIPEAADGYLVQNLVGRGGAFVPVVSREPGAQRPRFPTLLDLSPNADYVATDTAIGRLRVVERESRRDVTPDVGDKYDYTSILHWHDEDRLVVWAQVAGNRTRSYLLACSVSSGSCTLAAEHDANDGQIVYPGDPG